MAQIDEEAIHKLVAARYMLLRGEGGGKNAHPYLSTPVLAAPLVESHVIPTMASDKWGRIYYNPEFVKEVSIQELRTVVLEEVEHYLKDHHERLKNYPPEIANVGADAELHDNYRDYGLPLPKGAIYPDMLGMPEHLLAEEYCTHLIKNASRLNIMIVAEYNEGQDQDGGSSGSSDQSQQQADGQGQSSSQNAADQQGATSQQQVSSGGSSQSNNQQQGSGLQQQYSTGSTERGSQKASSQPQNQNGQQQTGSSGSEQEARVPRYYVEVYENDELIARFPFEGTANSSMQGPWEAPPPDKSDVPGISPAEKELIKRATAAAIREHIRNKGTVPEHWQRWTDSILEPPKVPWQKVLASSLRMAIAYVRGKTDYTYYKQNRRQSMRPDVILPGMVQPIPNIAVVLDTSGSISDDDLHNSMSEIAGILRSTAGMAPITVLATDAQVHSITPVMQVHDLKGKILGGGGTDMSVGIERAQKLHPKPHIIIVITDGWTDWPEAPPHGVKVIVCILPGGKDTVPEWASKIIMD
jgi:predicted metal-dependent peptidase